MILRASHSSVTLFKNCQRRYYHYKVARTKHDPDSNSDTRALRLGSCFHKILEDCLHDRSLITKELLEEAFKEGWFYAGDQDRLMIMVMVEKYLVLHQKSKLKIVVCEIEIGGADIVGFVDVVMAEEDGGFWIVDLKTAARIGDNLLSSLQADPQLNLYAAHVDQICKETGLEPSMFRGIRYRVTTKSTLKKKALESKEAFTKRLNEKIESYDIAIPAKDLKPQATLKEVLGNLKKMRALQATPMDEIPQNRSNCFSYFRPCEYWGQCHNGTFTEAAKSYQLLDSTSMGVVKTPSLMDNF